MEHRTIDPERLIKQCRVCDSKNLELAVDLGYQPWCNNFLKKEEVGKEAFYPLCVIFCMDCRTPQLNYTVPKEIMFGEHTYLSSITTTLSDHFKKVAGEIDERYFKDKPGKSALDIGSNDGVQLKHFKALGYEVLGVDSAETPVRMAREAGIPTEHAYFNAEFAKTLNRKFDIINAAGVFFHLEELHSAADGIKLLLGEDGVFIVQFLYMKRIVENLAFDQIYHEHLLYYNLRNLERLLERHGLAAFDAYLSPVHGGSIVAYVSHAGKRPRSESLEKLAKAEDDAKSNELSTYRDFAKRIEAMKQENLKYLGDAKKSGKKIYGFGAPVKGNTLLNYFGIGTEYLDCLVEKNTLREGLYSPGMHIPVVMENEVKDFPDIYYVLAWNFKEEILAHNQPLIDRGITFYFPVNPKAV